jgi:hypothetical protein
MLILNRQKIVTAQASTAYKHSLKEVLASPAIASQIKAPARSPCALAPLGGALAPLLLALQARWPALGDADGVQRLFCKAVAAWGSG